MNYTLDPIVLTEHQVRQQLNTLGYQTGDRVWLRLLKAKNMPLAEQLQRGLAWEREPGKIFEMAIDGYITIGAEQLTFTRLTRDPQTNEKTKERGYPFHWLLQQNAKGYGVYLAVNPGGREDAEITECRSLFYECDGVSKAAQWERLQSLEALLGRKATLVIETRNSLHCYFALEEPLMPEDFRQYQQRLIQQQDSDPAIHNPSRLMRLAGFDHQKWHQETAALEATPVRIVQSCDSRLTAAEFDRLLPALDQGQWGKQTKRKHTAGDAEGSESFPPSDPTGKPFDLRNFAHYLLQGGQRKKVGEVWHCFKCPAHNGDSSDSLHIEWSGGSIKCHAGCQPEAIHKAALAIAQEQGYDPYNLPQYTLSYPADVHSTSKFLGDIVIPDTAKLVCIKAPKGSGKTHLIEGLVEEATRNGTRTWVITYREQLGQQLARRTGIPYKTEVRCTAQGPMLGYVMCIDSLHPGAEIPFRAEGTQDDLVIIDECESVLWHVLDSSTCTKQRVSIFKQFAPFLKGTLAPGSKGRVVLADADLSDLSVKFVLGMAEQPDLKPFVILNDHKSEQKKIAYSYEEAANLMTAMKAAIAGGATNTLDDIIEAENEPKDGGKHLILTTGQKANSKWGTQTLEADLKKAFPDKSILRIDSATVADPTHLAYLCLLKDKAALADWLAKYDSVICAPTVESGVSFDLHDHFAGVWGFFTGISPESNVRQFIARLRDYNAPRHIYVAEKGIPAAFVGNGATDPKALQGGEYKKALLNRQAITTAFTSFDEAGNCSFNAAPLEAWGLFGARINQGLANYRLSVEAGLEAEGYTILGGTAFSKDERKTVSADMGEVRDENQKLNAEAIAAATPPEDEDAYEALKQKKTKTADERAAQRHYELERRYAVPVTPDRVLQDDAGWYPGVQLQYFLTCGFSQLTDRDQKRFEAIADLSGVAFSPDVNKSLLSVKVNTLKALSIDELLTEGIEFSKHNPLVKSILERMLQQQAALKDAFNFDLDTKTGTLGIGALNDLLRATMGIALKQSGQRGAKGSQYRVYTYIPGYGSTDRTTKQDEIDDRLTIFAAWLQRAQAQAEKTDSSAPAPLTTVGVSKSESLRDTHKKPIDLYKADGVYADGVCVRPEEALPVVTEHEGFKVGDRVLVSVDHFDKGTQNEIIRNNEAPVGRAGSITGFEWNTSGVRFGRKPFLLPVLDMGASTATVPLSYLRRTTDEVLDDEGRNASAPVGSLVKWGTRLGDWVVESIDGTQARVRAAAGWASGKVWDASLDDLRAACTASNRAIASSFPPGNQAPSNRLHG